MQRFFGRPLSSFWVACLFWLSLSTLMAPAARAQSMAAGVSWKGHVDTTLDFSEFFAADHTYVLRFMPQFPNAYEGPFIAENGGGRLLIGQGDYGVSGTKLLLAVGSVSKSYAVTLKAGEWHHLAVVATTSSTTRVFTAYLNGVALSTPLSVSSTDTQLPSGTLRLGKRTTGQTVNGRNAQFYGFLDDVAVFNRALSASEIQYLMTNVPQLTGNESGLLAGYTFNPGTLPAKLARPVTFQGSARRIAVSSNRSNTVDAPALPLPTQQVEMTLPFKTGEAWQVIQGYDTAGGSHKGYASFCWDFVLADKPQSGVYPNGSDGAPLYTAAPGSVVTVQESGVSGTGNSSNMVEIEQAPGEIAGYLHIRKDSADVTVGAAVTRGQKFALTGDTGVAVGAHHLHLATTDMRDGTAGFVTFPVVFSNYEVRDALGNWNHVFRGIPQPGEVVRVPANPTARYNAIWQRTTVAEQKVEGVRYADFRAAYDELWPEGWRLHQLQAYVVNGQVLYNAVWRPGTSSEVQVYGWSYADFRAKYDELWPQGWRLHLLQSYVLNNQVFYNAVWRPSTASELQVYGWSSQDFRAKYDELWPQGWRLKLLDAYQP